MVADADPFGTAAPHFIDFPGDAAILGRNVDFDLAMRQRGYFSLGFLGGFKTEEGRLDL